MQVSGRRQAQRQIAEQQKQRKSRSKGRFISMRLKLGTDPLKLHFQRPTKSYVDCYEPETSFPWKHGVKFFVKSKELNLPNGRYIESPGEECLISAYQDPHLFGFNDVAPHPILREAKPQDYFCVSGWVEQMYEIVEKSRDVDGETKTYKTRELVKRSGRNRQRSKNPQVFGNRFYFDFSNKQWRDVILAVDEEIARFAKDGGYLVLMDYTCEKCNQRLIDMSNNCFNCDSDKITFDVDMEHPQKSRHMAVCQNCKEDWSLLEYKDDELKKRVVIPMRCPECKHMGYPQPNYEHSEGKKKWDAYDIYDVQLTLRKQGEGKQTTVVCDYWEIKKPDPRLFDAQYQGEGDAAVAMAKRHGEPVDLDDVHSPDIAAVQAQILGLPNLFAGAGGSANNAPSRRWSAQDSNNDSNTGSGDDYEGYEENDVNDPSEPSEGGLFD